MKRFSQTQVQEALEKLDRPSLDRSKISQAQGQVWSRLNSSIQNSSMSKPSQSASTNSWQVALTNSRFWLIGSAIILVVVMSSLAARLVLSPNGNQPNSNEPIPIAQLKERADSRLAKLTGGVELTTLQATVQEVQRPENVPESAASNSSDQSISRTFINTDEAKRIIESEEIKDDVVFYTETEYTSFSPEEGSFGFASGFDYTKPILQKSWISANYSKNISLQDDKILDFYLSTPEYSITYLGGKYAIKEIYAESYYFSGLSLDSENSARNYEMEFLKFLLDPNNDFEDLGMQEVDGKFYRVIEMNNEAMLLGEEVADPAFDMAEPTPSNSTDTEADSNSDEVVSSDAQPEEYSEPATMPTEPWGVDSKTRYYIDQDKLTLYQTEYFEEGELLSRAKNLQSETYENEALDKFFNQSEISSVPIEEIRIAYPRPEDLTVSKFIQKYDLFYLPVLSQEYLSVYDNELWNTSDQYKLYESKDFNPNFSSDMLISEPNSWPSPIASYYQDFLITDIYAEKPIEYINSFGDPISTKSISINLGGNTVSADSYEFSNTGVTELVDDPEIGTTEAGSIQFMVFPHQDRWYVLSSAIFGDYEDQSSVNLTILEKLTPEEAEVIDSQTKQREEAEGESSMGFEGEVVGSEE